jgi:folate-binding protein YgfZ
LTDAPAAGVAGPSAADPAPVVVSPFAARDGFVDDGSGVAAHYGNPLTEQRALVRGAAVVDLSDRGVLTVSGPDRLSWLNSLTSQALLGLEPGRSTETLLLDANGRLEHAARVVDDGETTWLLVDRVEAEPLRAWLDRMRFMLRVEVADRTADVATIGALADVELPVPVLAPAGVPVVWVDPWREVAPGGHGYADAETHPGRDWSYREVLVDRADLAALAASDLPAAGTLALEALRIEAWRPRLSTEVDERSIPHELDWLRSAVHLAKGCYRGQETVAKVHNIGHPPRRLVMLHLDGSDTVLPAPGDPVVTAAAVAEATAAGSPLADLAPVGRVTSSAVHHELGPVALAVVKRTTDETAPLAVLSADIVVAAAPQTIVPASAGAAAGVPRLPRLGAVRR